MKLHQSLKSKVCILLTLMVGFSAYAQDIEQEVEAADDVEIQQQQQAPADFDDLSPVETTDVDEDSDPFAEESTTTSEETSTAETEEAVPVPEEPAVIEAPVQRYAEPTPSPALEHLPLVEVQIRQDNLADYKVRRETHGTYVSFDYEAIEFKNFISTLDGQSYKAVFGSDTVNLIQLGLDYKYNFMLGSLAAGALYGVGKVDGNSDRSLEITKYGIGFKFTADMLMNEPYVAPYVGINVWQMGFSEKSATDSFSATTQMGYNYTVGMLIQLDWIDYETAKQSTFSWGLENTFIDVYATQYAKTEAPDDPDTTTDFLFGGGLRLEF
ncbi:hypothetical protein [Bdellovibrio bacteriovorus]|uniref:Outer membrane protein beta-barrel domain-containing protein n=1 Tax=Bdellovibrio bacteriovorus str. Tiberius TaxID=1069642 RepID=K7ZCS2_BDEBC|nr:hypothetical protein [Bdellovibrio bacteriovorus]AFY03434.1 hypothetical protein Bdt_3761 [Bdellovibrio bacteriovorus str. Tiberius]